MRVTHAWCVTPFLLPMSDDLRRVEEKIAYLERHVVEQDKAMLELSDEIARLRLEVRQLRAQRSPQSSGEELPPDERPPHY
jgi:SlyX protein